MPELRLNLYEDAPLNQSLQKFDQYSDNTIERAKLDLFNEVWIEVKVKEKNIMKRNYHIAFVYKNKYVFMQLDVLKL